MWGIGGFGFGCVNSRAVTAPLPRQEAQRLEKELSALKGQLSEAEGTVSKLQRDLDALLLDKVRD